MLTCPPRLASRLSLAACLTVTISAAATVSPLAASAAHTSHYSARAARLVPHSLSVAARHSTKADRALVADAKALERCLSRHPSHPTTCTAQRHALQRAGGKLARAERRLASAARSSGRANGSRSEPYQRAPILTASGQTLTWTRVAHMRNYVLARIVPGQRVQYSVVNGTSVTPPPVPGATVAYSLRTAVNGSSWSAKVSISYKLPAKTPVESTPPVVSTPPVEEKAPPVEEKAPPVEKAPETVNAQAAPALSVSGQTLTWNQVGDVSTYVIMQRAPGQGEQYSAVSGTSYTPTPVPGATVYYSIRTAVDGSAWAPEVSITYPPTPPVTEPTPPTEPAGGVIIGTNDALGWGDEVAKKTFAAGMHSARVEAGAGLNTPQHAKEEGFTNNIVMVGNTADNERLATVNASSWTAKALTEVKEAAASGDVLMEVGNEMFLKGGQAEPVKYAELYVSLSNAVKAAGVTGVRLLFNDYGDYDMNGTWSLVPRGGGWLGDALRAQPSLRTIVAGFTQHPYGIAGENQEDNWGPGALKAEHAQAVALGFANTDFYVSEFGVRAEAGGATGSSSPTNQAERVREVYDELIATGYVKGIWFYESHDESSSAKWGFVSGSWTPRPVLGVLEEIARKENS